MNRIEQLVESNDLMVFHRLEHFVTTSMPHLFKAFEISKAIAHVINSLLSASPILSVMTGHQQWISRSIYCLSLTKMFLLSWSTTFLFMIDVNFSDEAM